MKITDKSLVYGLISLLLCLSISIYFAKTGLALLFLGLLTLLSIEVFGRLNRERERLKTARQLLADHLAQPNDRLYWPQDDSDWADFGFKLNRLLKNSKAKAAKANLSQERLSTVLSHVNLGLVLIDQNKTIQLSSQFFDDLFTGQIDLPLKTLLNLPHSHELAVLVNQVFQEKQRLDKELTLDFDQEKIFEVSAVPIIEENRVKQVLLLLYDVTSIRQLQKSRSNFVANASHELRTPITSIRGFAETLLEMEGHSDQETRFLEIIYRESLRLEGLVNDILKLSAAEHQQESDDLATVNLYETIEEISQGLQPKIKQKELTWELVGSQDLTYQCDKQALSQVLLNLFANAINYTESGGRVKTTIRQRNGQIDIQVADTGIGIPVKEQERIFERFYRVNKGRSRRSGGTGLGLSIVKNILKQMGAKISVSSQVGLGTAFTIHLPKK